MVSGASVSMNLGHIVFISLSQGLDPYTLSSWTLPTDICVAALISSGLTYATSGVTHKLQQSSPPIPFTPSSFLLH